MAIIACNPLINGLSGMLGKTVVFKNLRGKTIMANRPARPQKQSEQQRTNRSRFKAATAFAKAAMLDPDKKAYYWKKAKKLKLPNAYTAAITDYMRKPVMTVLSKSPNGDVHAVVSKKDFPLKKVEVYKDIEGTPQLLRVITPDSHNEYDVFLKGEEISSGIFLKIENEMKKIWLIAV